jgi:hypothetical protein
LLNASLPLSLLPSPLPLQLPSPLPTLLDGTLVNSVVIIIAPSSTASPPPAFHCRLQHLLIVECPTAQCIKASVDLNALILALSPLSPPIYPHAVNILHTPKSHKKPLSATALTTRALEGFQQNQVQASLSMV